jgi:hypothetical protein
MKRYFAIFLSAFALATSLAITAAPASAQTVVTVEVDANGVPAYDRWQAQWDRYLYDRRHVILGSITNFAPYRLQIVRGNGDVQNVDLKNGTVILPTGATPTQGERVALIGYYSKGTFIVSRLLIHV